LKEEEEEFFLFYSPDVWALGVIGLVRNPELYQTFFEISYSHGAAPWWSYVDLQLWSYFSKLEPCQTHP
jgi:hypothetical protein